MTKKVHILVFILIAFILTACSGPSALKAGEGFLEVNGGKIWYNVLGENDQIPIVMLHGGPSGTSYYLNPLTEIHHERPVIVFDQLGCGRSDRVVDTTFMTVAAHVEQTRKLLTHLGVRQFYLYGHSWGSILALEYYIKYQEGVKGLILNSPIYSSSLWESDADSLIATLPDSVARVLRADIEGVQQDPSTVAACVGVYLEKFGARRRPLSNDFTTALSQSGERVFAFLWGRSEFVVTGALKNYNRSDELKRIAVPTLYLVGEFDEVRLSTAQYYRSLTPDARLEVVRNSGHMTMHDNAADNIAAISKFLAGLDQ